MIKGVTQGRVTDNRFPKPSTYHIYPRCHYVILCCRVYNSAYVAADWSHFIFWVFSFWSLIFRKHGIYFTLKHIDKIIVPYFSNARKIRGLPAEHKGLVIFDVFKAHTSESVLQKLKDNNLAYVFVPGNCTGQLQPLELMGRLGQTSEI